MTMSGYTRKRYIASDREKKEVTCPIWLCLFVFSFISVGLLVWFVGLLVCWFIGWCIGLFVCWLVSWLVGGSVGWLVVWLGGWLVGWLVG